jgi:hypothetical protein
MLVHIGTTLNIDDLRALNSWLDVNKDTTGLTKLVVDEQLVRLDGSFRSGPVTATIRRSGNLSRDLDDAWRSLGVQ